MKSAVRIAIVGATGAVGKELISVLEQRKFPVSDAVLLSSPRSEGKTLQLQGRPYRVRTLTPGCFEGVDVAFFDASDAVSKEWVPQAAESGAWVVDNSSTFRMEDDIPLLVPEVNGDLLDSLLSRGDQNLTPRQRILSGPNCSTVQMVVALKPILDRWGLKRVLVSTYQSASGAGAAAVEELSQQAAGVFSGKRLAPKAFKHQIAFNCIPQIGGFVPKEKARIPLDGYTSEEQKIMEETRKILRMPDLRVSATAVRVPTFSCHGESVHVECEKTLGPNAVEEVREALRSFPGIILQDDPSRFIYPMGMAGEESIVESATGRDAVYVGRVRRDPSVDNGLNLWVVSDNLRKGAALNAVQVGEILVRKLAH